MTKGSLTPEQEAEDATLSEPKEKPNEEIGNLIKGAVFGSLAGYYPDLGANCGADLIQAIDQISGVIARGKLGVGLPDASSDNVSAVLQNPFYRMHIGSSLQWLDEFVVEPEYFPGGGDSEWWWERRAEIRQIAKELSSVHDGNATGASTGVSAPNPSGSPASGASSGELIQELADEEPCIYGSHTRGRCAAKTCWGCRARAVLALDETQTPSTQSHVETQNALNMNPPTTLETWLPEARQLAAQCWCDEETSAVQVTQGRWTVEKGVVTVSIGCRDVKRYYFDLRHETILTELCYEINASLKDE